MANCCPLPSALTTVPATVCPVDLGQIQRILPVRRGYVGWDTATPANNYPASIVGLAPTAVAGWTILKAAVDDTKVLFPPLFGGGITITPADPNTFGGNDNETLNGETYVVGFPPSTFVARYDQLTAAQDLAFTDLECETLEVYFVNGDGNIIGERDGLIFKGFSITAFYFKGREVLGFGTRNNNMIGFQMAKNWSSKFEVITPTDFNALTF